MTEKKDRQRTTAAELYGDMTPEEFYEAWGRLWKRAQAGTGSSDEDDFTDEEWGILNRGILAMYQRPPPREEEEQS